MLCRLASVPLAALVFLAGCSASPEEERPNLILVSLDTVRADHLGAWGHPRALTPWLDRLARRGGQFAHCVAQSASTLPSHRSLFRSRLASRSGGPHPMLAETLSEAGWTTVAFTGGGNVAGELGFSAGFDVWEENDAGFSWGVPRFERWLDDRPGVPFFAFLHTYDAHLPYDPPALWVRRLDPDYAGPVTGPETRALCRTIRGLKVEEAWSGKTDLDEHDRRHLVALYDAGIADLDRRIGTLFRAIESRDLHGSTAIVVVSDHGEEFWEHGSVAHSHTVYRELVHVPLIIAAPGEDRRVLGGVVRNLDVAPTIVDLAGLDAAPSHAGESLLGRLRGGPDTALRAVSEMKSWKSLADSPWKVVARSPSARPELYHLGEDPGEQRDRSRELRDLAGRLVESLASAATGEDVPELADGLSPELEERLRALGYLE